MRKHYSIPIQFLIVFFLCCAYSKSFSQFSYYDDAKMFSIEFGLGAAAYYGDLTEKVKPLDQANLAASFGLSYSVTSQIRPMLTLSFLKLGADDKFNTRQELKNRNLNFQSNVLDLNLGVRYHFFSASDKLLTPYIHGGVGIFYFNPYTTDRAGIKRFLQPLGTEGQRLPDATMAPYKLTQFQIPFGAGINYTLDNQISLALDLTVRKTFTDYIDDVSTFYANPTQLQAQDPTLPSLAFRGDELVPNASYPNATYPRGNPDKNDLYYTVGFKIIYQIFY